MTLPNEFVNVLCEFSQPCQNFQMIDHSALETAAPTLNNFKQLSVSNNLEQLSTSSKQIV